MMKNLDILSSKTNEKNTIIFNGTMLNINYVARTSTAGKEFDMVTRYVNYLLKKYGEFKRKKAAIFIEPQIDTGYPDIVVVEFCSLPPLQWSTMRNTLSGIDMKILFYIQTHGYSKICDLESTLGYSEEVLLKSISKLRKCGLIYASHRYRSVQSVSLKSYCRVNKIISIEAKIDKWHEAIRQASNNIWFSTESYILMNKDSCSTKIQEDCRKRGVGIILVNGKVETVLTSEQRKFPVSYASLQFNEWILRYINIGANRE